MDADQEQQHLIQAHERPLGFVANIPAKLPSRLGFGPVRRPGGFESPNSTSLLGAGRAT
jgi:hypothetical protein